MDNNLAFEQAKKRFNVAYYSVFSEISAMLRTAKLMPIDDLCVEDPSFNKRAQGLVETLHNLELVAPHFNVKYDKDMIKEYVQLVVNLASAIDAEDPESLGAAIAALNLKSLP